MTDRNPHTHRPRLLTILARLDQLTTEAEAILAEPVEGDIGVRAEELREMLEEMRALVEEKLDRAESAG